MWHGTEDLIEERRRTGQRPERDAAAPLLDAVGLRAEGDPAEYARRLRELLDAALGAAVGAPGAELPVWFERIGGLRPETAPDFARAGRERYLAHPGTDGAWQTEDWLSRFEPEEGIRAWAWWDLTGSGAAAALRRGAPKSRKPHGAGALSGADALRIWIDAAGEAHYPYLDLLWAAYTAGAVRVAAPVGARAEEWAAEASFALPE